MNLVRITQQKKNVVLAALVLFSISGPAVAATAQSGWGGWLIEQLTQHPELIAARHKIEINQAIAQGYQQPLYNPELETELEHEGSDNNIRIGVSQTIDWWDKQAARQQQGQHSLTSAQQAYQLLLQQKAAAALQTLIEWQLAGEQAQQARNQENQLGTLIELVRQRQQAGDLGQLDAELVYLSLSQTLNTTAQAVVQLKQLEVSLRQQLPDWSAQRLQPTQLAGAIDRSAADAEQIGQWVDQFPEVLAARAEWKLAQQSAQLTRVENRADPTFGINAGTAGDDTVLALSFSMPLQLRNNYSAETETAQQQVLAAEADYLALRRQQQFAIESSQVTLDEYRQRYEHWQRIMQGRSERTETLLKTLWSNGDMNTTDYLLALQQINEGLIAGLELHSRYQLAHIDWLLQTGQILAALQQLK
ncbi:MAG: TolC family protein [Gammaproteobacteria bacterium]|nr:TolC family protein [Gammaproteobacteria bacterium]